MDEDFQDFIDAVSAAVTDFGQGIGKQFSGGVQAQGRIFAFQMGDLAFGLQTGHYDPEDADWLRDEYIESLKTRLLGFAEISRVLLERLVNAVLDALRVLVNATAGFPVL